MSSTIFYSCFDSIDGKSKVFYSCYALRFYEKFSLFNTSYYIPKAFLIFSQYPYFTAFHNICLNILEQINEKNKNEIVSDSDYDDKDIPIEILIHCLVNYIPSPINKNLILKLFQKKSDNFLEKLRAKIPVICSQGFMGTDGKYQDLDELEEYAEEIKDYKILNYYNLFK